MKIIKALNEIAPNIIKWPTNENTADIINKFKSFAGISEPSLKFIDAFIAYPGSVSDNRIFRNSPIYNVMNDNYENLLNDTFIIGDKAYPLLEWCIPPYIERQQLTPQQSNFNNAHAKTRQVVERSFALLFGRFRRLKYLDMNRTDLIPSTVIACCVLHNICLDYTDLLVGEYIQEGNEFLANNANNNEHVDDINVDRGRRGKTKRDNISAELYARQII